MVSTVPPLPPQSTPNAGGRPPPVIRQLDASLVALIAAGEVVERPTSVVKELAENAIDAGASSISIDIQRGGFARIRVRDDGCGIAADQLTLALARHATSKLANEADLAAVQSLGFRGEAIASIAAVSHLRITSRVPGRDDARTIATVAGTVIESGPIAAPFGTTITVGELFFNTPARHAFQRSPGGEARAITQIVTHLALATPHIRWQLTVEATTTLTTPGTGSGRDASVACYGAGIAPHLIDLPTHEEPDGRVRIRGIVANPTIHRATRTTCLFVINGRVVRSQSLSHAVAEAYHSLVPHGRHPVATLHIDVPATDVDVNVHPTKLEVRLRHERLVYSRVRDTVRQALLRASTERTPSLSSPTRTTLDVPAPTVPIGLGWMSRTGALLPARDASDGHSVLAKHAGERNDADTVAPAVASLPGREVAVTSPVSVRADADPFADLRQADENAVRSSEQVPTASDVHVPTSHPSTWRALGQVGLTYIVVEAPEGMYLIDQHSAHERVQYETIKQQPEPMRSFTQPLLTPTLVELTAVQSTWLHANGEALRSLGYDLEPFGHNPGTEVWRVRAVPLTSRVRTGGNLPNLIDGLIDNEFGTGPLEDQALWAVACHSSVRAGDHLTITEMQALLDHLANCDLRQTCPHGRPTMIHLSHTQLAREFGRSAPVGRQRRSRPAG